MKSSSPLFDDLSTVALGAVGAMKALGEEASTLRRARKDAKIADEDLASRDEVEVLKEMLRAALDRIDALESDIAALKAK